MNIKICSTKPVHEPQLALALVCLRTSSSVNKPLSLMALQIAPLVTPLQPHTSSVSCIAAALLWPWWPTSPMFDSPNISLSRMSGQGVDIERAIGFDFLAVLTMPKRIKIEDIQRVVARQYNVSRSDLLSSRRTANVVRPRQVAMYLAKTLTLRSLPEIGRRFGGRDHTTVMHADRKIRQLMAERRSIYNQVNELTTRIKQQAR